MTSGHRQPARVGRLPTIAVLVAAAALLFSFFAQDFATLLALLALVLAVIVLVRTRVSRAGKGPGIAALVIGFLALIIAAATGSAAQQGFQQATAPVPAVDPNALPATVTITTLQTPDNLVTSTGRLLHVTAMQGHPATSACQNASDTATATGLVTGKTVQIAAPDPPRTDVAQAVPAGFQPVLVTLPDGRDYAQAWTAAAPSNAAASCTTPAPEPPVTTTTQEPDPTTTTRQPASDPDVDRPYVPEPRIRTHSGHSGHPCLPGERDGDGDGYCGE